MPKESKRFINPLLRPTVEVATKQEEVPTTQPERPISSELTHTSTNTYPATSQETLAAAQIPELPSPFPLTTESHPPAKRHVEYPSTDTSTFQEETKPSEKPRTREPLPVEREISDEVPGGEHMMLYTSSMVSRYKDDQAAASGRGAIVDYPAPSSTAPSQRTQVSSSASHPDVWTPTPLLDTSPLPATSTYTSTESDTSSAYGQRDAVVEQEHYSAPPPSRRRRGAQSFEQTHERITLWIDKRLKQAFEELAYEQEISKTALLNEAMADLLNKYASR